jgi:hypothetical protein
LLLLPLLPVVVVKHGRLPLTPPPLVGLSSGKRRRRRECKRG